MEFNFLSKHCSRTKLAARFALRSHLFIVVEAIGLTTLLTGIEDMVFASRRLMAACTMMWASALIWCRIRIVDMEYDRPDV